MNVVHKITGYDKRTEYLALEHDIPPNRLHEAKLIANIGLEDQDVVGSYPLDAAQVRAIAKLANATVDVDRYDWFLEPFSEMATTTRV